MYADKDCGQDDSIKSGKKRQKTNHSMNSTEEIEYLKRQLSESQARLVEVEAAAAHWRKNAVHFNEQHDEVARQLFAKNASLAAAEAALEVATAERQAALLVIADLRRNLVEQEAALVQAKQDLAESQQFFAGSQNLLEIADSEAGRLIEQRDSLRAANTALSAQVEELKRDGERLDWLADNSLWSGKPGVPGQLVCSPLKQPDGNGLRTAIDSARAHAKQSGEKASCLAPGGKLSAPAENQKT